MLFRNDGGNANHSLRIKLVGTRSNRDGIGTMAIVKANGDRQTQMLRSGSGYLSSSELVLTFGLGKAAQADEIELHWPSGQVDKLSKVAAGQTITVREGAGIVHGAAIREDASAWDFACREPQSQGSAMKPVTQQSTVEMLALLRDSKISPLELADKYIAQIERLNPRLNALVDFDPERVREQVRAAERSKSTAGSTLRTACNDKRVDLCCWSSLRDWQPHQPWQCAYRGCDCGFAAAKCGGDHPWHHQQPGISDGV